MLMDPGETSGAFVAARRCARPACRRPRRRADPARPALPGRRRQDPHADRLGRSAGGRADQHGRRPDRRRPRSPGRSRPAPARPSRHHPGLREGLRGALGPRRGQRLAVGGGGRAHRLAAAGNDRLRPLGLRAPARRRSRRGRRGADRRGHRVRPARHGRGGASRRCFATAGGSGGTAGSSMPRISPSARTPPRRSAGRAVTGGAHRRRDAAAGRAPTPKAWLDAVRDIVGDDGGASAWSVAGTGKLLARLVAGDGYLLRKRLVPLIGLLNGQAGLPKVWSL